MQDAIVFKGIRQGILVTLPQEGEWAQLAADLASKIDEQIGFFQGANIVLQVGKRGVRQYELSSLITLLQKRDVRLICVISVSATTQGATRKLGLATELDEIVEPPPPPVAPGISEEVLHENTQSIMTAPVLDSEVIGTEGVLIRRTLRSGKLIRSGGHVVILGDVNAGAKIIAGGDVIVWGRLRGVVHAGANGDEGCMVCALDLQPTQLRIGSLITVIPPSKRRRPRPERAFVENGQIRSEEWNG